MVNPDGYVITAEPGPGGCRLVSSSQPKQGDVSQTRAVPRGGGDLGEVSESQERGGSSKWNATGVM